MSKVEIMRELPKLSHGERREIMRRLFELEQDAFALVESQRAADARFQTLDAMEAEDAAKSAR